MKNVLWIVFALLAIGAVVFILYYTPKELPGFQNVTENKTIEPSGAQLGDLLKINFVLTLENGTVVDTNDPMLAQENNLRNYVKGPYTFILGQSGKVKGFDSALIGLDAGETGDFIIEPSEPELYINLTREKEYDRFVPVPKLQRIKIDQFIERYGAEPAIGKSYSAPNKTLPVKVLNMTEKTVLAELMVREKQEYYLHDDKWPSQVATITEEDILFYQKPLDGQIIDTPFGPAEVDVNNKTYLLRFNPELHGFVNHSVQTGGIYLIQQFQIIEITKDYFTIKRYGVLADKRLNLHAEVLERVENVKTVRNESKLQTKIVT